jgi:hypothetical protein
MLPKMGTDRSELGIRTASFAGYWVATLGFAMALAAFELVGDGCGIDHVLFMWRCGQS